MNFQDWIKSVDGRSVGNGQCWGLAEDYNVRVIGGSTLATAPSPHAGYACGVWDGYGSNGVEKFYSQAPATALAQAGWIPIWKWGSANAPLSHIAVALGDVGIGVDCMTQNPGATHRMTISKAGLYGYLVPRSSGGGITLAGDVSSNPFQGVTDAVNNVTHLADQITAIQSFFAQPGIWQRIGLYALGALILLAAAIYMFKDSDLINPDLLKAVPQ